jgi:hypothetical protein
MKFLPTRPLEFARPSGKVAFAGEAEPRRFDGVRGEDDKARVHTMLVPL